MKRRQFRRTLTEGRWRLLRRVFDRFAGHRPAPGWEAILCACRGDREVAVELRELLDPGGPEIGFLRRPDESGSAPWSTPAAGVVLMDRYRLGRRLGRGGSGVVRAARDLKTGRAVAVKFMPGRDPSEVRREAASLLWLAVPGVVKLLDDGYEGGMAFLITERVPGCPFPGRKATVPWEELLPVATALMETVGRIHSGGLVHGDLKPANVLVDRRGSPVVLDLGIARESRHRRTGPGQGTLGFTAPEVWRSGQPHPREDLFSIGIMIRRALGCTDSGPIPTAVAPSPTRRLLRDLVDGDPARRPESVAEALDRLPRSGIPVAMPAAPLTAVGLESLFSGPEPFLHLRSAPARELWHRSGGDPERALNEASSWLRASLATRGRDGRLRVDRGALERLESDPNGNGRVDTLAVALRKGGTREIVQRAGAVARRRLHGGRPEAALEALCAGLAVAGAANDLASESHLLPSALLCGLRSGRTSSLERVRALALRAGEGGAVATAVAELARCAMLCVAGRGREAHDAIVAMGRGGVVPGVPLQRARWAILLRSAPALGPEVERRHLRAAARWAARVGTRDSRGAHREWRGWWLYRNHRFDEARRLHEEAARLAGDPSLRISRRLNAAAAALDGFLFEDARRLAALAGQSATRLRHPLHELRATTLQRQASYRSGCSLEPRLDLAEAAFEVGSPHEAAMLALNEAAVAWRLRAGPVARRLSACAATLWTSPHHLWLRRLAEAIRWRNGGPEPDWSMEEAVAEAPRAGVPAVARQAAALRTTHVFDCESTSREPRCTGPLREVLSDGEIAAAMEVGRIPPRRREASRGG